MSRPTTKSDLISDSESSFKKMLTLVGGIPKEEQVASFNFDQSYGKEAHWGRDKNLRDVFIHLYEWHMLLLNWVQNNKAKEDVPFLPAPYNWRTYGEMNRQFVLEHKSTSFDSSKQMLIESHQEVMELVNTFTNQELFEKKVFSWTGASTLGSYFVSSTASHYLWAIKKIKAHIKTYSMNS